MGAMRPCHYNQQNQDMKNKFYEIELFGKVWRLELRKGKYMTNDNLAIGVYTDEGEEFAILTVNLGWVLPESYAFIDTNNCPWAEKFLTENKIAKQEGPCAPSGCCSYPLFVFSEDILAEMSEI